MVSELTPADRARLRNFAVNSAPGEWPRLTLALLDALDAAEREREAGRWITCGYTYPDENVEARIEAQRAELGFAIGLGCGSRLDWKFSYRCVECGRFFCQDCILKHFADNGDPLANALNAWRAVGMALGVESAERASHLARILVATYDTESGEDYAELLRREKQEGGTL